MNGDSQTKLATLAMVDVPWQNSNKYRFWDKVSQGSAHIFVGTQIPANIV